MKIYLVVGRRNMAAATVHGGLYANVGQTSRTVSERLNDKDYKRKNMAGEFIIILEKEVSGITDRDIHDMLRQHKEVKWDASSPNTEEFLFIGDVGDGALASRIVNSCIEKLEKQEKTEKTESLVFKKLKQSGINPLSSFSSVNMYWFVLRSFQKKIDRNGNPYIVMSTYDVSKKNMTTVFCYNWRVEDPKLNTIWVALASKAKAPGAFITSYSKIKYISDFDPAVTIPPEIKVEIIGDNAQYTQNLKSEVEFLLKEKREYVLKNAELLHKTKELETVNQKLKKVERKNEHLFLRTRELEIQRDGYIKQYENLRFMAYILPLSLLFAWAMWVIVNS